jgi:hypothetical protein
MASTLKTESSREKSISETFAMKAQAIVWAREVVAPMDARVFADVRGPANITLKEFID